jgi:hypothetical protein
MIEQHKSPQLMIRNRAWRPAVERLNESLTRNRRTQAESAQVLKEQLTRVRFALFGCAPL